MRTYQLTFSDGKTCRCITTNPDDSEQEDVRSIRDNFHAGHLVSAERVIPPAPTKIPWRRNGDHWEFARFRLIRLGAGLFRLEWPDGSTEGDKDHVSSSLRINWNLGC